MTKRLSAANRRMQILDEASRLFAFKGLHGTTTKDIAKAAGVSEPVLYQHFNSKEEIYQTLERMCQTQTAYFKQIIKDRGEGLEVLVTITYLLIRIISFSKAPGEKSNRKSASTSEILLRLMGYSFLEDGRFARALVENCIGSFFEQWKSSYRITMKKGHLQIEELDETSLWLAYESLIGIGLFTLPAQRLVDRIEDPEVATRAATLFILRGLGLKEKVLQKVIHWPSLRKSFGEAMAVSKKFQDAL